MIVRVNDRGPFYGNRIIDLSAGAAKKKTWLLQTGDCPGES
jgi:rare lipoprotein A